jgi:hypothetical protein
MGILPMCITGVPPVSLQLQLLLLCKRRNRRSKNMGETPMRLMAKMAMLHTGKMPVPRYCPYISRLILRNSSQAARRASSV